MMRKDIVFMGMAALAALAGCGEHAPPAPVDYVTLREREPVSESFNIIYRYTLEGRLRAILMAPHVAEMPIPQNRKDDQMVADVLGDPSEREQVILNTFTLADSGVKIEFFAPTGQLESRLEAARAEMYDNDGYAVATGQVRVRNAEGHLLETERLYWYRDRDQIASDRFVKITTPEEIIMGDSMTANTNFTNYRIYHIRGIIKLQE